MFLWCSNLHKGILILWGDSKTTKLKTKKFSKMNYSKLMEKNPTKYGEILNQKNQLIEFYEHPYYGQDVPVIAVCHELKLAALTTFYELDDMIAQDGEYTPLFIEGSIKYGYEFI